MPQRIQLVWMQISVRFVHYVCIHLRRFYHPIMMDRVADLDGVISFRGITLALQMTMH